MVPLQDKVAVIAGSSSGIGKAIGTAYSKAGAAVVFAARSVDKLNALVGSLQNEAMAHGADLTVDREVDRLFEAVMDRHGRVDLLVNATGAFDGGPIDQLTTSAWNKVLATNLTAPFFCTRAAFRIMKQQRSGRIINIGSTSAKRVREDTAAYCASKFGIQGLTESTALEGRPFGITCSCIHPGNVLVERRRDTSNPMDAEPMIDTESVVALAITMATLPQNTNILDATILPRDQAYIGRG